METHQILAQPFGRIAIPAANSWLRVMIAPGLPGAYLLLEKDKPFYVGRSDHCVLSRLLGHEKILLASHVLWEPCSSKVRAYHLESFWFDHLAPSGVLLNTAHPARPEGHKGDCPFCAIKPDHVRAIIPIWSSHVAEQPQRQEGALDLVPILRA